MSSASTGWSRHLWLAAKVLLSAAVLALLFSGIDWTAFVVAVQSASVTAILAALVLLPAQLWLRVVRWRSLLTHAGSPVRTVDVSRTIIAGYAFAVVTPAEIGDVALRMHLQDDRSKSQVAGLVILEKFLHSLLSLAAGIPALVLLLTGQTVFAVVAACIMISLTGAVLFRHSIVARIRPGRRWSRWKAVDDVFDVIASVPRSELLRTAGTTTLIGLVYVVQEYALVNAVTSLGPIETWNAFWAGIGLRTLAPIFVMDLGIREASHVAFFGTYGVSPAVAIAVSLLMFGVNVLLPTMIGLVVFLTDRRGRT